MQKTQKDGNRRKWKKLENGTLEMNFAQRDLSRAVLQTTLTDICSKPATAYFSLFTFVSSCLFFPYLSSLVQLLLIIFSPLLSATLVRFQE